jgi:tyrosine-protein phosphatase SIW14
MKISAAASVFLSALIVSAGVLGRTAPRTPQASGTGTQSAHAMAKKVAIEGLPNFGEVTPTLYRGAQPTSRGLRKLKDMGFDIVVDFRTDHESEKRKVTALGMEYEAIPWMCVNPKDEDVARFLSLIRAHPGKKIFIHCRDGVDRTGMEIAAYRMAEQNWTSAEARLEMNAFGFSALHRSICTPLVPYEANFPQRFQTRPAFENLRGADTGR